MSDSAPYVPELPEHPELREIAQLIEDTGMMGEILDERFRCVFFSSESARTMGLSADEARAAIGISLITRTVHEAFADIARVDEASGNAWTKQNVPIMRRYVQPGDPDFDAVFDVAAPYAEKVEPVEVAPRAWYDRLSLPPHLRFRRNMLGDQYQSQLRLNDDGGRFLGVLFLYRSTMPESLVQRLGRGDARLFERMDRVSDPGRRSAAILFADLEASGDLSRRLSSRAYFELIRDLTDLIDSSVVDRDGIVGKHAGDGGSALFLTGDFDGSESAAARAAVEAARAIREGSGDLGPDDVTVKLNIGVHWGATLMVGQVATRGRLEVTALGDQMNEGARIEAAARDGAILASKDLVERLDTEDAAATGLDPDALAYTPLAELDGVSDKAIRDAGTIPVTAI
ncbi:MAG TPA: adenylate/guanylate cyclase domain-containing protein [Solirubrobacteraceae bacterium]|nr:adenylate/guanylate cyclase domain-containing protein [Solirubrobacteraceae bacterium]